MPTEPLATIPFTKTELRELIQLAIIGAHVRNGVLEDEKKYVPKEHEALASRLLAIAGEAEQLYVRKHEDHYDLTRDFEDECMEFVDKYEDEAFWEELELRLSKRDFDRTMNSDESVPLEGTASVYHNEFELYGVDRLEINKKAPVVSPLM